MIMMIRPFLFIAKHFRLYICAIMVHMHLGQGPNRNEFPSESIHELIPYKVIMVKRNVILYVALLATLTMGSLLYLHIIVLEPTTASSNSKPNKPLRIAQVSLPIDSVPPKGYGAIERIVYYLVEEMVKQGHNVTLFATPGSNTSAAELVTNLKWEQLDLKTRFARRQELISWQVEQLRRRIDEFDIIHFHYTEDQCFKMLDAKDHNKIVATFHWVVYGGTVQAWAKKLNKPLCAESIYGPREIILQENSSSFPENQFVLPSSLTHDVLARYDKKHLQLVSISNDQVSNFKDKLVNPNVFNIYHGLPKNLYPFTAKPSGGKEQYLAFIGRITHDKGAHSAIEIAVRAGIRLKIAAKMDGWIDNHYWENVTKPLMDKHRDMVEIVGEIDDTQKSQFFGNALALLFPIHWKEPFGIVMIEAMACGTPVVARRRGSVSEVVDQNITGLVFDTDEQAVEAVKRVHTIDRAQVRRRFEQRFTAKIMADNYVKLFERMVQRNEKQAPPAVTIA